MDGRATVPITDSDLASNADEDVLREAGITTVRLNATTEDDVIAALSQVPADALIVQWAPITAAVLDAAPRCRFISRLGIGIDMIDVEAATRRGVAVANTPDYCVDEVAAHTLAMAMWLVRVSAVSGACSVTRWELPSRSSSEVSGIPPPGAAYGSCPITWKPSALAWAATCDPMRPSPTTPMTVSAGRAAAG